MIKAVVTPMSGSANETINVIIWIAACFGFGAVSLWWRRKTRGTSPRPEVNPSEVTGWSAPFARLARRNRIAHILVAALFWGIPMTAAIELATAFRHPERSAILGGVAALGFGMVVGRRFDDQYATARDWTAPETCDQCPHPMSEHTHSRPTDDETGWMHCQAPGCEACWHDWPALREAASAE